MAVHLSRCLLQHMLGYDRCFDETNALGTFKRMVQATCQNISWKFQISTCIAVRARTNVEDAVLPINIICTLVQVPLAAHAGLRQVF